VTRYRPFRQKRSYGLAAALIILALGLTYLSLPRVQTARSLFSAALYPFQYSASAVWHFGVGLPGELLNLRRLAAENTGLKERVARQEAQLGVLAELQGENDRLRDELGLVRSARFGGKLLAVPVVGRSGSPWPGVLEIGRGRRSGVRVNMPVVAQAGLVGRVSEVAELSAKVLLISDPLSAVAAVDQRSRDLGVIEGYSPDTLYLRYIGTGGDVQAGDRIVTAAVSSIFPAGIPLGTVTSATKADADLFYRIAVKPAVELGRLDTVFLVF